MLIADLVLALASLVPLTKPAIDLLAVPKGTPAAQATASKKRTAAVKFFAGLGPAALPALRHICDRLVIPPLLPAEDVFDAIEKIDPKLYTPLRELVLSNGTADKTRHVQAIEKLGEKARPAAGVLVFYLQECGVKRAALDGITLAKVDLEFAMAIFDALLVARPDDLNSINVLKELANPKQRSDIVAALATAYLATWAEGSPTRTKDLVAVLANTINSPCTDLAVMSLKKCGLLGATAKDNLPQIKKLKLSDRAAVREAATEAAAAIEKDLKK